MNPLERFVYEWGRILTTFYPAGPLALGARMGPSPEVQVIVEAFKRAFATEAACDE